MLISSQQAAILKLVADNGLFTSAAQVFDFTIACVVTGWDEGITTVMDLLERAFAAANVS